MYVGSLLFCFAMVLPINLCVAKWVSVFTTPWLVSIQKQAFDSDHESIIYHCTGVLIGYNVVLTSVRCFNTFPENSQMIIVAGSTYRTDNLDDKDVQKHFLHDTQLLENSKIISISIDTSFYPSKYVNIIKQCTQPNCEFDKFGFQYGWSDRYDRQRQREVYDFSNSTALCIDVNEDPQYKYCTHHICNGEDGFDGWFVIKLHKRKPLLMGFWDYDACDKNIRVFDKLLHSDPYETNF